MCHARCQTLLTTIAGADHATRMLILLLLIDDRPNRPIESYFRQRSSLGWQIGAMGIKSLKDS